MRSRQEPRSGQPTVRAAARRRAAGLRLARAGGGAPHILSALSPADPASDAPWQTTAARWDTGADELLLAIEIDTDAQTRVALVAALPLDASTLARTLAYVEPARGAQVAVAP